MCTVRCCSASSEVNRGEVYDEADGDEVGGQTETRGGGWNFSGNKDTFYSLHSIWRRTLRCGDVLERNSTRLWCVAGVSVAVSLWCCPNTSGQTNTLTTSLLLNDIMSRQTWRECFLPWRYWWPNLWLALWETFHATEEQICLLSRADVWVLFNHCVTVGGW